MCIIKYVNWVIKGQKVTKMGKSENLTVAPKIACQIMDSFILTFVMHGNVRKDNLDCSDMHFRPLNAYNIT